MYQAGVVDDHHGNFVAILGALPMVPSMIICAIFMETFFSASGACAAADAMNAKVSAALASNLFLNIMLFLLEGVGCWIRGGQYISCSISYRPTRKDRRAIRDECRISRLVGMEGL